MLTNKRVVNESLFLPAAQTIVLYKGIFREGINRFKFNEEKKIKKKIVFHHEI